MNSLFTRISFLIAFLAVSFGVNAQTISTDLNNRPNVQVGVQEDFVVAVNAGPNMFTSVKLKITLDNPAQESDIALSVMFPGSGSYTNLIFDGNGVSESTALPLITTNIDARVTFNAPGTYNYSISIINAGTNAVMANSDETVVVAAPVVAPTISSSLNGTTLTTGVETSYTISTTPGSYAGTMVRVFFKMDPSQVGNATVEYFEPNPAPGAWLPFTIGGNGETIFGPGSGFPLGANSSLFRVTYNTAGVYNSRMAIVTAAAPYDTLVSVYESVTVLDYVNPTISSSLNGSTVYTGDETSYAVTTTAGSENGTMVRGFFKLLNPSQVNDVNVSYEVSAGVYAPLTLDPNGTASFGPGTGFPLQDTSSNFKVTFDAAGVYDYKLYIYEVSTNDTLASVLESVTVVDPTAIVPEISSDLDGRTGVVINNEENFSVTTVKNNAPNANVRIKITLDTPTQAAFIAMSFNNPATSAFEELTFDANGVAYAGNASGFALADEDYDFKVTFVEGGTYGYTLELVNVAGDISLANKAEEVIVTDNSNINENTSIVSQVFPNPTADVVNIQTTENGTGVLSVYTVTGQQILNRNINGSVHSVSLETLTAGMYIIKISQNGKEAVIRVVKK